VCFEWSLPDEQPSVQVHRLHREGAQGVHRADSTFKQRYTAHKESFKHQNQAHHTALSNYIWNLKSNDTPFSASWSIMKQASTFSKETMNCQLCLTEKTLISLADRSTSLNKRSEIMGKCRHRDKWLLKHRLFFLTPPPPSPIYLPSAR